MLSRLMNWLFPPPDCKGVERIMQKYWDRADALGIPDDEQELMWKAAVKRSDPLIVGQAPGSLFANLMDNWEKDRAGLIAYLREYVTAP